MVCVLLLGVCGAIGADDSIPAQWPMDDYVGREVLNRKQMVLLAGGWTEVGTNHKKLLSDADVYPVETSSSELALKQIYLFAEKKMNDEKRMDWGIRADVAYGRDAPGMQSYGDRSFDSDWLSDNGYGLAIPQLYAVVRFNKFSIGYGKFLTPIGWELSPSINNFFYSHSYCFEIEPSTHVGAMA